MIKYIQEIKLFLQNKKSDDKWLKFVMLIAIIVLVMMNWSSCSSRTKERNQYEQNQEAMKKEIVTEKNKNGFLQSSIVAFQGDIKEIRGYSEELYQEIKALKGRKPSVIAKTEIIYKDTNIFITNNVVDIIGLDKDEYRISWKYSNKDSTRILEGNSVFRALFKDEKLEVTPKYTNITLDQIKLDFVVGVAKNKKTKYNEIFITPKNENVTVGKLEGAILDKSKIGIDLSVSAGYGAYYGKGSFGFGPFIGLSISKPIIRF
jgi:hypothetical protein